MAGENLSVGELEPQKGQQEIVDKIVGAFASSELGTPEDYTALVEQAAANNEYGALGAAKARLDFGRTDSEDPFEQASSDFIIDYLTNDEAERAYNKAYDDTLAQLKSETQGPGHEQPNELVDAPDQVTPESKSELDKDRREERMRRALHKAQAFKPNPHDQSEN
jgi:hypothetical protein